MYDIYLENRCSFINEDNTLFIERSRSGIPCGWEQGGGWSNTGNVLLIGDKNGERKKALFVRNTGQLACNKHALIPICIGDRVLVLDRHGREFVTHSYVITDIAENYASLKEVDYMNLEMLTAAYEKSTDYHCRIPVYIQ